MSADPSVPRRKRVAAISVISSSVSNVIALAKGYAFYPLYVAYFGLDTLGAWSASADVIGLLGSLELGLNTIFSQRLAAAYGAKDKQQFSDLVGAGVFLFAVVSSTIAAFALAIVPWLPRIVNAPPGAASDLAFTFALTGIGTAANLTGFALHSIPGAWQMPTVSVVARLGAQVLEAVLIVVCLVQGLGVRSLGIAACAGGTFCLVLSVLWISHSWRGLGLPRPRITITTVRDLLRSTLPMLAAKIVAQVSGNLDKLLVSNLSNPAAAGVYSLTERAFRIVQMFILPLGGSILPGLANLVGENNRRRARDVIVDIVSLWTVATAVAIPVFVSINRDLVGLWVGPGGYGGLALTIAFGLYSVVTTRSFILYSALAAIGETRKAATLAIVESALRLPLMAVGLVTLGPLGIPLLTSLAYFITLWMYPSFMRQGLEMSESDCRKLRTLGSLQVVLAAVSICVLASTLSPAATWISLMLRAAVFAALCAGICVGTSEPIRSALKHLLGARLVGLRS